MARIYYKIWKSKNQVVADIRNLGVLEWTQNYKQIEETVTNKLKRYRRT